MKKLITFEERKLIQKYLKEGLVRKEIARRLGRSHYGIGLEISVNGGIEKYDAKEAQKRSTFMRQERNQKLQKKLSETEINAIQQGIENKETANHISYRTGIRVSTIRKYMIDNNINYEPNFFKSRIEYLESITILERKVQKIEDRLNAIEEVQSSMKEYPSRSN